MAKTVKKEPKEKDPNLELKILKTKKQYRMLFGFLLVLLSIAFLVSFISFFVSGQADQSAVGDPHGVRRRIDGGGLGAFRGGDVAQGPNGIPARVQHRHLAAAAGAIKPILRGVEGDLVHARHHVGGAKRLAIGGGEDGQLAVGAGDEEAARCAPIEGQAVRLFRRCRRPDRTDGAVVIRGADDEQCVVGLDVQEQPAGIVLGHDDFGSGRDGECGGDLLFVRINGPQGRTVIVADEDTIDPGGSEREGVAWPGQRDLAGDFKCVTVDDDELLLLADAGVVTVLLRIGGRVHDRAGLDLLQQLLCFEVDDVEGAVARVGEEQPVFDHIHLQQIEAAA